MRINVFAALLALLVLASCTSKEPESILEAGIRLPDLEGVVDDINNDTMTLDGKSYPISKTVESFTTFKDHRVTPIIHWQGRYVHVGLDDDRVQWIAGIGIVGPSDKTVIYTGKFLRIDDGRAVFEDGTALTLGRGIKAPKKGFQAVAVIDSRTDKVTEIQSKELPS